LGNPIFAGPGAKSLYLLMDVCGMDVPTLTDSPKAINLSGKTKSHTIKSTTKKSTKPYADMDGTSLEFGNAK